MADSLVWALTRSNNSFLCAGVEQIDAEIQLLPRGNLMASKTAKFCISNSATIDLSQGVDRRVKCVVLTKKLPKLPRRAAILGL